MNLNNYIGRFEKLRVARRDGHESPHKPCMLLAAVGLAEAGLLEANRIDYAPPLLDRYLEIFEIVRTESDHPNPYFPFFHLRGDGFWHLEAKPGKEAILAVMSTARSHAEISENIAHAYLDPELHACLADAGTRDQLRQSLIVRWFGQHAHTLSRLFQEDHYEKGLRDVVADRAAEEAPVRYGRAARDTAFRRVVTEAYDYRCAASGMRIVLPEDIVMVEAAHLIPFSETQDDDPRNGIALTPNFHWALDRYLIAPGPDYKWRVSKLVDERIADNRPLIELAGKELLLPKDERFWPRMDACERRMTMLRT